MDEFEVPANSSRHFATAEEARQQPTGRIRLAWDDADPYLFNAAFDPALIAHDEAYCTTVRDMAGALQIPTLDYLGRVLRHVDGRVVDIGCGQGEFVTALRARGLDAVGYDPVLREESGTLNARYWTPRDEAGASLFVMRCVLPHIPDPWAWVRGMGGAHPGALLLVEFQRIEWMAERGVWYQLAHDHVNQFTVADFTGRFEVVDQGVFGDGEWAWVLFRPDTYRRPEPRRCDIGTVTRLLDARRDTLAALAGRRAVLWGAAGKGIVLAHALTSHGVEVAFAVDADPARQGRFMEVSGVPVISPTDAHDRLHDETVVVCNPRHGSAVREYLSGRAELEDVHHAGIVG